MTFEELVKLPRLGEGGLLGHWIEANENNDTKMIDLTMSAMVEQNKKINIFGESGKRKESFSDGFKEFKESEADRSRRLNLRRSLLG